MTPEQLQQEIDKTRATFQRTGNPRDRQLYEDLEDLLIEATLKGKAKQ